MRRQIERMRGYPTLVTPALRNPWRGTQNSHSVRTDWEPADPLPSRLGAACPITELFSSQSPEAPNTTSVSGCIHMVADMTMTVCPIWKRDGASTARSLTGVVNLSAWPRGRGCLSGSGEPASWWRGIKISVVCHASSRRDNRSHEVIRVRRRKTNRRPLRLVVVRPFPTATVDETENPEVTSFGSMGTSGQDARAIDA